MTDPIQVLKNAGIRPSKQRIAVYKAICSSCFHPTAEDVLATLAADPDDSFSRATLYNTLNLFEEKGIIIKMKTDSAQAHYETNTKFHSHFICEKCGRITDISSDEPVIELPEGYQAKNVSLNINGICCDCRSK